MFISHRLAEALIDSPTLGIWLVVCNYKMARLQLSTLILQVYHTTRRTHTRQDPPALTTPHTHHQMTCVASASSLSRVCNPLSCAAPPATLARAGSARRTCSPRAARAVHRALRAIAPEAGVCSSTLLSRQRSFCFRPNSALMSTDVPKSSISNTKKQSGFFFGIIPRGGGMGT